jgi:hypothetical protein
MRLSKSTGKPILPSGILYLPDSGRACQLLAHLRQVTCPPAHLPTSPLASAHGAGNSGRQDFADLRKEEEALRPAEHTAPGPGLEPEPEPELDGVSQMETRFRSKRVFPVTDLF